MSGETDILIAYITCPTLEEARPIGRALVEQHLAACVNIRQHEAIYRWDGDVQTGTEQGLIAKTTKSAFPHLREAVRALHSDRLPGIVAVQVVDGNPDFLAWIGTETAQACPGLVQC